MGDAVKTVAGACGSYHVQIALHPDLGSAIGHAHVHAWLASILLGVPLPTSALT